MENFLIVTVLTAAFGLWCNICLLLMTYKNNNDPIKMNFLVERNQR